MIDPVFSKTVAKNELFTAIRNADSSIKSVAAFRVASVFDRNRFDLSASDFSWMVREAAKLSV